MDTSDRRFFDYIVVGCGGIGSAAVYWLSKRAHSGTITQTCLCNHNFLANSLNNFLIFAQNIDCGYPLEPVLTSTHNKCVRAKIKQLYPS